ncbi:MAG: DUF72 domain-containing protein [Chloroflexota bacterium]
MATYYIGTSGWHYDHWRDTFYPQGLSRAEWLKFYASHFATVELNNSFYRLPSEAAFANWHDSSPASFTFAVKVSRFITHIKRLKGSGEAVAKFIARAEGLGEKLGPLLYQLPPNMKRDDERLESFLSILPPARKHVFEFRHQSWLEDRVFEVLARYKVGFAAFDMPDTICPLVATADFAYIRFHGSTSLYSSDYSDKELSEWARRLAKLARHLKAVYIYFNNDSGGYALKNARTLSNYLQPGAGEG